MESKIFTGFMDENIYIFAGVALFCLLYPGSVNCVIVRVIVTLHKHPLRFLHVLVGLICAKILQ